MRPTHRLSGKKKRLIYHSELRNRGGLVREGLSEKGILINQLNTETVPATGSLGTESSRPREQKCKGPGAGVTPEDEEGGAVRLERDVRGCEGPDHISLVG